MPDDSLVPQANPDLPTGQVEDLNDDQTLLALLTGVKKYPISHDALDSQPTTKPK